MTLRSISVVFSGDDFKRLSEQKELSGLTWRDWIIWLARNSKDRNLSLQKEKKK